MRATLILLLYLTCGVVFATLIDANHQQRCPAEKHMTIVDGAVVTVFWFPLVTGTTVASLLVPKTYGERCD